MLKRFIEQLVTDLGFDAPEEPKEGEPYVMSFEPKLKVQMREDQEGSIRLFSVLCPLPTEKVDEYMHFLMGANLFGQETGGGFLGIDSEEKSVTFTRFIDKEADFQEFKLNLELFLNYAETWRTDTKAYVG